MHRTRRCNRLVVVRIYHPIVDVGQRRLLARSCCLLRYPTCQATMASTETLKSSKTSSIGLPICAWTIAPSITSDSLRPTDKAPPLKNSSRTDDISCLCRETTFNISGSDEPSSAAAFKNAQPLKSGWANQLLSVETSASVAFESVLAVSAKLLLNQEIQFSCR